MVRVLVRSSFGGLFLWFLSYVTAGHSSACLLDRSWSWRGVHRANQVCGCARRHPWSATRRLSQIADISPQEPPCVARPRPCRPAARRLTRKLMPRRGHRRRTSSGLARICCNQHLVICICTASTPQLLAWLEACMTGCPTACQ